MSAREATCSHISAVAHWLLLAWATCCNSGLYAAAIHSMAKVALTFSFVHAPQRLRPSLFFGEQRLRGVCVLRRLMDGVCYLNGM